MQEQQPGPSVSARGAHYPTCQTPMTKAQHEEVGGAASTRRRRGEEIGYNIHIRLNSIVYKHRKVCFATRFNLEALAVLMTWYSDGRLPSVRGTCVSRCCTLEFAAWACPLAVSQFSVRNRPHEPHGSQPCFGSQPAPGAAWADGFLIQSRPEVLRETNSGWHWSCPPLRALVPTLVARRTGPSRGPCKERQSRCPRSCTRPAWQDPGLILRPSVGVSAQ